MRKCPQTVAVEDGNNSQCLQILTFSCADLNMWHAFFFPLTNVTTCKISCTKKGISDCLNLQIPSEHTAGASGKGCVPHTHLFSRPWKYSPHAPYVAASKFLPWGRVTGERHQRAAGSLPASRLLSLCSPQSQGPHSAWLAGGTTEGRNGWGGTTESWGGGLACGRRIVERELLQMCVFHHFRQVHLLFRIHRQEKECWRRGRVVMGLPLSWQKR